MKVLMIENEKSVAHRIEELLSNMDDSIRIVAVTGTLHEAAQWVQRNQVPDIILANKIILPEDGWQKKDDTMALVTFSTSSEEFNFHAFRYRNIQHILQAVEPFGKFVTLKNNPQGLVKTQTTVFYKERFLVKQGQKLLSVPTEQIAYFFSQGRFIFFKTYDNQKFLTEYRIEQLESVLPPSRFFRINRSFIVALNSVREIHAYFGNRLKLYLSPSSDKEVIVSRKRVGDFKNWLGK